ncbi:MAG: dihydroorotate dehydrogenase (quinone), partial [Rhodospirillales bacterium]
RLPADGAVINRLGFNSAGADAVARNLRRRRNRGSGPVGVNLGKNAASAEAEADYAAGAAAFAGLADYVVVNVSSPNTPGLRALQGREPLRALLAAVKGALAEAAPATPPPLLLKVAPDLTDDDKRDIAEAALEAEIDGLIATNTTIARPAELKDVRAGEAGGLSGRPLFEPSTRVLADLYRLTEGRIAMIGVGGVASGADAYAKVRAGASLVQLYTALVFEGPGLAARINAELAALLERDGFANVGDAVGADHRERA